MLRLEPFTSLHIIFQSGRFDHSDRLFCSLAKAWTAVSTFANDYRELTPEFFSLPDFFNNFNGLDLGVFQNGKICSDVELPPWAKNSFGFVNLNRQALESEWVRTKLNEWIDLIFGCYQRSLEKNNLFHKFSYVDCMNTIKNKKMYHTVKNFCANFGCCPVQVFHKPHRKSSPIPPPPPAVDQPFDQCPQKIIFFGNGISVDEDGDLFRIGTFARESVFHLKRAQFSELIYLRKCNQFLCLHPTGGFASVLPSESILAHKASLIKCMAQVDIEMIVTGGSDCLVYIWRMPDCRLIGTIPVHSSPILSIDGDASLNIVVFVNSSHEIFLSYLFDMKSFLSFAMDCDEKCAHRILLLNNGAIACSCELETSFKILFFSWSGVSLGEIQMKGELVKMFQVTTKAAETFLVVTKLSKKVKIINCTTFTIEKVLDQRPYPELVAAVDDTRRLAMIEGAPRRPAAAGVDARLLVIPF
jgi:hypothetical protein